MASYTDGQGYDIEERLITESGRIGPDIYQRTLNSSPWNRLIKQEPWPDELGVTINVMTFERSLPNNVPSWVNVGTSVLTENGGSLGGACLPPVQEIDWAQTLRSYNLQHMALQSPALCLNDLRIAFKRKEQLSSMMKVLTQNTNYAWQDRMRDEYTRLCGTQVILTDGLPSGNGSFPAALPTYTLTQGVLRKYYQQLIHDGGGEHPLDRENARPVFGLITDSPTSENLILNDPSIRQDYRWSSKVNELLAPLGIERSYGGFFHLIDDFGPRWDWVAGAWVRRYPYVAQATTLGNGYQIDPNYINAEYMDSFIFHQDVYTSLVPAPLANPGGEVRFDPQNYRGDFKWLNIQHPTENPDKNIGFFRGVFMNASKPVMPYFGIVIRHLRCDVPLGLSICTS